MLIALRLALLGLAVVLAALAGCCFAWFNYPAFAFCGIIALAMVLAFALTFER